MLKISINGEVHSSKNSRRIAFNRKTKKPFVTKSKSSKADESVFLEQLVKQKWAWDVMMQGAKFPVILVFHFRRKTKRKFDYVNMAQGILDAFVKAEYLPDDDCYHVLPLFKPFVLDKDNPGCDITIPDASVLTSSLMYFYQL